jgi:transcriptional repressor NrdR
VRRRRRCSACGHRFTTFERYERRPLHVRKRDGERQSFDRDKLLGGLARASHKRPVAEADLAAIADRIEAAAEKAGGELPAARVGEMCLDGLRRLDRVSYLQFAAVYKQLDVEQVRAEIAALSPAGSVRPAGDPA